MKEKSSLIIGEGATIKGEIKEENEITIQGNVDGDIECKDLIVGKTGSIKGKIKADTLTVESGRMSQKTDFFPFQNGEVCLLQVINTQRKPGLNLKVATQKTRYSDPKSYTGWEARFKEI